MEAKFKSKQKAVTINSLTDDGSIAVNFASFFTDICKPNFANENKKLKDNFKNMYTNYLLTCSYYDQLISVEDIGRCMHQNENRTSCTF